VPSNPRRSPKPQERQRDSERTRTLILDAASTEFGAHGYAGARISAIAARAGVNQQLISYYFDGKEGLYQAMSQRWQQRQRELVPPGTPLPEQLRRNALEALHNPAGVRSGRLPAEVDPACLLVMLMAAAMATTTLPHVIEGVCGTDPRSPELIEHFADQVAVLARLIGLEPPDAPGPQES